jgi:hypothetical protein
MEPHWGGANRVYNASTGYDELQNFVEVVLQPPVGFDRALDLRAPPTRPLRLDTVRLEDVIP